MIEINWFRDIGIYRMLNEKCNYIKYTECCKVQLC